MVVSTTTGSVESDSALVAREGFVDAALCAK
jgi:hypothetical protein